MNPSRSRWRALLVRSGKARARAAIIGFSVLASVVLVFALILVVNAPRDDWALYLVPAVIVPLIVSPMASHLVLELAFELDAAHAHALRQEAQLRALFEHAPIGIAHLDAAGRVRSANSRLRALLGTTALDTGPDWAAVFADAQAHGEFMRALQHAQPLDATQWIWSDPEGHERTVRVALVPMPPAPDTPSRTGSDHILLADDVTEREAVEAQLLRAQKLELVGQLAGGLAHDFNNLLTVVRASVASLGGTAAAPELAAIDDAAVRGARLTRRLLSISRQDLLSRTPQRIRPVVHDSLELIQRVLPSRIRVLAPDDIPDVAARLDMDAVQQALLNLAVNARDAIAGEGTIRLEAITAEHEHSPMLVLAVIDNGTGMSHDVRTRAIEPFFTTKPADAGSGLGLAMLHGTMRRHDGRLVLHSTPGAGTRAELWFPIVPLPSSATWPTPAVAHEPVVTAREGATTPGTMSPAATPPDDALTRDAARAHVLLVEDEPAVRTATERALQRLGYSVTSACDMASALALVRSGVRADLFISDVMMPGGTGVELLHALRALGCTTPMLLVSGYALDNLDAVLAADPHTALLGKPWTLDRLAEQVRRMLPEPTTAVGH